LSTVQQWNNDDDGNGSVAVTMMKTIVGTPLPFLLCWKTTVTNVSDHLSIMSTEM